MGISGVMPFIVHEIIIRKKNYFNLLISDAIIYLNVLSGVSLSFLSARFFV